MLKVLILPFDVASKAPITLDALNKIPGVEAKGIFVNGSDERTARSAHALHYAWYYFRKNPIKWTTTYISKSYHMARLINWADVLHWIWDSSFVGDWDLKWAKKLKKPGLIEWSGSDIRYPERNKEFNKYSNLLYTSDYEFGEIESKEISFARQLKFSKIGFTPLVTPEMDLYVRKDLFKKTFHTLHRLNVNDFARVNNVNTRPLVVHSPTRRHAKGTKYVLDAVEILKKEIDFDFRLIEGIPRKEALSLVSQCDIFIDQLLLGSNGMASCEAMSMGKPVLCYIMPGVYENGLPDICPIMNTNPENILQNLRTLLNDSTLRAQLGLKGLEYARKYLDVDVKAKELVMFYKELIDNKKRSF